MFENGDQYSTDTLHKRLYELKSTGFTYAELDCIFRRGPGWSMARMLPNKTSRQDMIESAGGKCEKCGEPSDRLVAHHESYDRDASMVLCLRCHSKSHKWWQEIRRQFKKTEEYQRYVETVFTWQQNYSVGDEDTFTIDELAHKWLVTPVTVLAMIRSGQLTAHRSETDLRRYLVSVDGVKKIEGICYRPKRKQL